MLVAVGFGFMNRAGMYWRWKEIEKILTETQGKWWNFWGSIGI